MECSYLKNVGGGGGSIIGTAVAIDKRYFWLNWKVLFIFISRQEGVLMSKFTNFTAARLQVLVEKNVLFLEIKGKCWILF